MPKSRIRKTVELELTIKSASERSGVDLGGERNPEGRGGRIMYIERKAGGLQGGARIGRVTFSQTGRTIYYRGQKFQSLKGAGFKSNYFEMENDEHYWISGPKRNGGDGLYGADGAEIDEEVREEYWRSIRRQPGRVNDKVS